MGVKDILTSIGVAAVTAALVFAAFQIGRRCPLTGPVTPDKPQIDTLYIRDTITAEKPVFLVRHVLDTVWLQAVDSLRDTVFVALPREQVEWTDSLATVWASGVAVEVDSVRHYVTQQVVTIRERVKVPARWSLGVSAGCGLGKDGLTPFVGVGVSYALLSW